jgi:hypothetical protein
MRVTNNTEGLRRKSLAKEIVVYIDTAVATTM